MSTFDAPGPNPSASSVQLYVMSNLKEELGNEANDQGPTANDSF